MNRRQVTLGLGGLAALGAVATAYELGDTRSTDTLGWRRVSWWAAFPPRDSARTFWLGGRLFMSNGYVWGGAARRDLWSTVDGKNWSSVTLSTPYEAYSAIAPVGKTIYALLTQMWKSTDGGVNWTRILRKLPFEVTADSPLVVVNGILTIITATTVWTYNESANSWTRIGTTPGAPRYIPQALVFKGALLLIGGCDFGAPNTPPERGYPGFTTKNDVWKSTDGGTNWTEIVSNLPCEPRMWPTACVHEDKLYLMGGYDDLSGAKNYTDTFVTGNGEHWERLHLSREFTERHAPFSYSLDGELYIAAGNANPNGRTLNDIWKLGV